MGTPHVRRPVLLVKDPLTGVSVEVSAVLVAAEFPDQRARSLALLAVRRAERTGADWSGQERPTSGSPAENSHADPVDSSTTLLGTGQAAERLGVNPRTLRRLTAKGDIPKVHIGRAVRYDPDDLDAYIASRKATP